MNKLEHALFQVSLKLIVKNRKGEFLLLKNPDSSSMPGYYDLAGGRIKIHEIATSFRKVIDREVKEELGKDVKYQLIESPVAIGRHPPSSPEKPYMLWVFFVAEYLSGKITVSEEHVNYVWAKLNKNNLKKYFIKGPLEGMKSYFSGKYD